MAQRGGGASQWKVIGKSGQVWQVRHINPYSDGSPRHWPGKPYQPSSEEKYLIQLAKAWVKQDGLEQPGVEYYLDKLPAGYAVFEVHQPGGSQVYKRLFGHPSGKYYDSIVRFGVHFLWLMSGMHGICECVHCGHHRPKPIIPRTRFTFDRVVLPKEQNRVLYEYDSVGSTRSNSADARHPGGTSTRPQRQIKAVGAPYAYDEEGVEDVYKELLKRLEAAQGSRRGIEDDIREVNSMDWRAEHFWDGMGSDLIQRTLTTIEHQHSFVPRVGELVLWTPNFLDDHYLMLDEESGEYKFYSPDQNCFHGFPTWRGGVVAAAPSTTGSDGPVDFPDIQTLPDKSNALNRAGFRVETFPDPNNEVDKKASKQYRYVPLRNIRPLSQWQMLLRGIPQEKWHPTIRHALTCMTSLSLLEKWWFNGDWPNASIQCKGIYIGAELITVGDTVRIMPDASTKARKCTDVLVVDSIRLNLHDITPAQTSPDSPLLSSASSITLVGRAYTLDIRRHYQMQGKANVMQSKLPSPVPKQEVKTVFPPVGSGDYGSWYHLHDPNNRFEISHDEVLGRMYEAAAVQLWMGLLQRKPSKGQPAIRPKLDYDIRAIQEGRRYATQVDLRLEEAHQAQVLWFWADTRAEALDIETINGVEVSKYDDIRDKKTLESWRTQLRILNGHPVPTDLFKFTSAFPELPGATRGRKPGSKVVNGKVILPGAPGYDEAISDHIADRDEVQPTPKHKTSQLAGAALVSTDDEEEAFEDAEEILSTVEDNDDKYIGKRIKEHKDPGEEHSLDDDNTELRTYQQRWGAAFSLLESDESNPEHVTRQDQSPVPQPKQERTKQQIMSNANAYVSDEDDWYGDPIPIRGGTEESEGGDYDPRMESD
ncbi:hypothetical protein A1O1_00239 [Capronia coronata CBS 617.96]|uniref:Cryptic loci regulator 2 N-terminal domain-containing protein n=1 Tax=Capronia coronata CBS 617.96 TaxID=1182541 RepID=W9YZK0_9EURO|nr:uncharacterized protein A1O1_00239 [Capronia coronata CBS 617.96]EXJ95120.1 hypothetical protein A1O1_00239 [Capronia coronata CBS 617.96]